MADKHTFSVLIRWDNMDLDQGEFGDTVRARSAHEAERIVRAHMIRSHWENHREKGESRRESLSSYRNHDGTYFGAVVDCCEGAIWKAKELEAALRGLLAQVDEVARTRGWPDNVPRNAAKAILDEIDGF